jgi:arginase family enzyme
MNRLIAALFAATAAVASPAIASPAIATFPPETQAKVDALSPEKKAFVDDAAALAGFGLTPDKLAVEFAKRSAADVDAYVGALMAVVADSKFQPGSDAGEIALNPNASNFNASTVLRPAMFDKLWREPGPFSLDRYMYQKGGIPTFAHAPVAIRREDLIAGKVEVAFVGVPADFSSGWRDAKHGPALLRAMGGLVGSEVDSLVNPNVELRLADYGNLAIDYMAPERGLDHIQMMIRDIATTGAVPFIVGGDHSISFADIAGVVAAYGKGTVGLVQLDAHPEDDEEGDHRITDRQTTARLLSDGIVAGKDIVQIGLRGPAADAATLKRLRDEGVRYHTMAAVAERGWEAVSDQVIEQARAGPANVFVSFDMSVLDPSAAAGVGRPVPGGLTMREATPLVRRLCAETRVVGFELLDPAPVLDPTYQTTMAGNTIMHACLTGIAMRKKGLTQADYANALSAGGK